MGHKVLYINAGSAAGQRRGGRRARRWTRWRRWYRESFVTVLAHFLVWSCSVLLLFKNKNKRFLFLFSIAVSLVRRNANVGCVVSVKPASVTRTAGNAIFAWTRPGTAVRTSWGRNVGSVSVRSGPAFRWTPFNHSHSLHPPLFNTNVYSTNTLFFNRWFLLSWIVYLSTLLKQYSPVFLSQTGSLKYARSDDLGDTRQGEPSSRKHSKHCGWRKMKRHSRGGKYCTDDENDDDFKSEGGRSPRKGRRGRAKKHGRHIKRVTDEEEDKASDPEIEDGGPGDLERVSEAW